MKTVLILILVVGLGVAFYLGWFNFSSHNGNDKTNITLSVDKDKIEADKDKVVDTVQDLGRTARDKAAATTQKNQD